MDFTFFPLFLPSPTGKGEVLSSGCEVPGCWLGLNHNTEGEESLRRERWRLMWLQKVSTEKIRAISTSHKITTKTFSWKLVEAVLLSSYSCCYQLWSIQEKTSLRSRPTLRSSPTTFPQPHSFFKLTRKPNSNGHKWEPDWQLSWK